MASVQERPRLGTIGAAYSSPTLIGNQCRATGAANTVASDSRRRSSFKLAHRRGPPLRGAAAWPATSGAPLRLPDVVVDAVVHVAQHRVMGDAVEHPPSETLGRVGQQPLAKVFGRVLVRPERLV